MSAHVPPEMLAMPCGRVLEAEQGHANATEIYETGPSELSEIDNCNLRSGDEFNPVEDRRKSRIHDTCICGHCLNWYAIRVDQKGSQTIVEGREKMKPKKQDS